MPQGSNDTDVRGLMKSPQLSADVCGRLLLIRRKVSAFSTAFPRPHAAATFFWPPLAPVLSMAKDQDSRVTADASFQGGCLSQEGFCGGRIQGSGTLSTPLGLLAENRRPRWLSETQWGPSPSHFSALEPYLLYRTNSCFHMQTKGIS